MKVYFIWCDNMSKPVQQIFTQGCLFVSKTITGIMTFYSQRFNASKSQSDHQENTVNGAEVCLERILQNFKYSVNARI